MPLPEPIMDGRPRIGDWVDIGGVMTLYLGGPTVPEVAALPDRTEWPQWKTIANRPRSVLFSLLEHAAFCQCRYITWDIEVCGELTAELIGTLVTEEGQRVAEIWDREASMERPRPPHDPMEWPELSPSTFNAESMRMRATLTTEFCYEWDGDDHGAFERKARSRLPVGEKFTADNIRLLYDRVAKSTARVFARTR